MKCKKITKLAAKLSQSPPGLLGFLHTYKKAHTQVRKELSQVERQKYKAIVKEWSEKRLPPRMQQRYVYSDDSHRPKANFFALV